MKIIINLNKYGPHYFYNIEIVNKIINKIIKKIYKLTNKL